VYGVRFSPFASGRLVTSGTGHIRFWRMASTFTGLKLQVRGPGKGLGASAVRYIVLVASGWHVSKNARVSAARVRLPDGLIQTPTAHCSNIPAAHPGPAGSPGQVWCAGVERHCGVC
jgi:hypothetical protein